MSPRTLLVALSVLLLAALAGCGGSGAPGTFPAPTTSSSASPSVSGPQEVTVSLRADITTAQSDAIRAALEAMPGVRTVVFQSQQQAYQLYKEHNPGASVQLAAFTSGYLADVTSPQAADTVQAQVRNMPGVDSVTSHPKTTR